jgi:hypothetical protein
MLMYGIAPAPFPFQRADVVTREIIGGRDLSTFMAATVTTAERTGAWDATRALVRAMNAAGVRHHDLNVKNIMIARDAPAACLNAYLLDVDRVQFGAPHSLEVRRGNVERLRRSARKWRDERGASFDEQELSGLADSTDSVR